MIIQIEDGMEAFLPQKEIHSHPNQPYRVSGSLDMVGDITLTGNLIVQQSQWVYLRGPITSSHALINGPVTASSLLIRGVRGNGERGEGWGKAEIEGELVVSGIHLSEKITELENRIKSLENEINRRGKG
jgi:hypothetical protein